MQMSQILTFVMPQPVAPYQSEVAPSGTQSNSTSVAFPTQRLIPLATPKHFRGAPEGFQQNASPAQANQPNQEFVTGGPPSDVGGTAGSG
jgi:hypothetical protein